MANTVIALKKSATPTAAPADLANGELAINYADGKLYYKNATGQIVSIVSGGNSFGTVNANNTLVVADTTGDVLSIEPGTNIAIVGDAINDKITISLQNDVIIPSTGSFKVAAVGNDEGGEIKLGNAITNSVLTGDIIIDVYQNRLRFYESLGTNRGAFINLASAATGVGTDLLAGSSGTDTTARDWAASAFGQANTARDHANASFGKANTADTNAINAFGKANTAGTDAINAYGQANTATTNAGNAFGQANTARDHANAAFGAANTAGTNAINAFGKANTSGTDAINAFAKANAALPNTAGVTFAGALTIPDTLFVALNGTSSLAVTGEIAEFAHNANSYTQIHVRNANTGTQASGDLVVTADSGTDVLDFVDLGINGSGFNQAAWTINGAKDAYLYASNGNFAIGVANVARSLTFFTGGTLAANERLRIDPSGNVLIGRTTSTVGQAVKLDVAGAVNASALLVNGTAIDTGFASGTKLAFQQNTAPTGWTKDTTHNDKAMRIVSGNVTTGGTVAFTTAFASKAVAGTLTSNTQGGSLTSNTQGGTVGGFTLTTTEMPSHTHAINASLGTGQGVQRQTGYGATLDPATSATGGGGSHSHSFTGTAHTHAFTGTAHTHAFTGTAINLAVQYVDFIIATKN